MEKYKSMYKCRLCGKEFCKNEMSHSDADLASITLIACETAYHQSNPELTIHRKEIHNCDDGSFGFSDFLGMKKYTEND